VSTEYSGRNLSVRSADNPTRSVEVNSTTRSVDATGPAISAEIRGEAIEPARSSRGVLPAPRVSSYEALEAPELPGGQTAPLNRGLRTKGLNSVAVFKCTRSGRVPRVTVFTNSVVRLVTKLQAVHIEGDSSSIEVPTTLFKLITLQEAI
jgi:hypothetical protein